MRILLDSLLFLSLFISPWWASCAIAFIGIFFFSSFYEIIVAGFIMDILYGAPNTFFMNIQFASTITAILLLAGGIVIKKRMIFYP